MTINEFGQNSFVTHTTGLKERIQAKENQMRPYRGLTKEGEEVRGWLFMLDGHAYIIPLSDNFHTPSSFICGFVEVIPETVGQFTGLKDKNGKEIDWWEDDLLQSLGADKRIGQIKYKEKYAEWRLYVDGKSWCSLAAAYYDSWRKVGTIHQNPELMEQNNDSKNP